jgi:hypothetical protein
MRTAPSSSPLTGIGGSRSQHVEPPALKVIYDATRARFSKVLWLGSQQFETALLAAMSQERCEAACRAAIRVHPSP